MKPFSRARMPRLLAYAAALALAACAPARVETGPAPGEEGRRIVQMLEESTAEWNRGSLDGFLVPYADGAEVTFVGSTGLVRGKAAIRDKYQSSYFRTGAPAGMLAFRDVEVRMLGADDALAVGRYVVTDRASGQQTATGIFSLVLRRTGEQR